MTARDARPGDVRWLLGFARPATRLLSGSVIARVLGQTLGAGVLAVPAWEIGRVAAGVSSGAGAVVGIVIAVVVLATLKAVLRYTEQLLGHLAAFRLMGEMRVWVIDSLISQGPAVTEGAGAARVQAIATRDVDRVEVFFAHTIAPAVTAVVIPVAAVITAAAVAPDRCRPWSWRSCSQRGSCCP